MSAQVDTVRPGTTEPDATTAIANLIRFFETGEVVDGLFAPDVFLDVSFPQWRVQAGSADELVGIRTRSHPCPGAVTVSRAEPTSRGFTLEFEERWQDQGQDWYCREMARADVVGATIVELIIYCTGDWDQAQQRAHADQVRLLRP